jgi:hypothetical protein
MLPSEVEPLWSEEVRDLTVLSTNIHLEGFLTVLYVLVSRLLACLLFSQGHARTLVACCAGASPM